MIALKMAWGNLFLHKAKSLLLGTIMGLGIAILFVGNSLIDTAIGGLEKMFVEGYTGDLMVTGPTSFPTTIFGDTAGGEEVLPHIALYSRYFDRLSETEGVQAFLPMLSGKVAIGLGEQVIGESAAFGVDFSGYRDFFSGNLSLVEGEWPENGTDNPIILSEASASILSASAGKKIGVGDAVVLSALGDSAGTVIREARVSGIVRFTQSNRELAQVSLVDADTLRDLLGFASLRDGPLALTADQRDFVENFDPDALFSEGDLLGGTEAGPRASPHTAQTVSPEATGASLPLEPEAAWQFILIKAEKGADQGRLLRDLKAFASSLESGDRVQDWVAGAGSVARTALMVRLVFDLMVTVVAVVVIMITMNVLVVSIGERVPEIGTLRALGARRNLVRTMILMETGLLSLLAGLAGLAIGYMALKILGKSGIEAPNLFFEALFSGRKLMPSISSGAAVKAFAWIFSMSILSSLYPIAIALRIRPVVAMQGE